MARPPEPQYNFTIPSIHDDTTLDCRIYHPDNLNDTTDIAPESSWKKRGIVMAHPYAPMGGSYDDRIVGIVVEEFLKAEWIVGTFNFRGAHGSKGRTSWSGRSELDDYTSYAAFFMHYMSYLRPHPSTDVTFAPEQSPVPPTPSNPTRTLSDACPIIILGGYSYGSLILRHLPPVPTILQPFVAPLTGSSADEILLRARKLADQSNLEWINLAQDEARSRKKSRKGHESRPSMTMGGEETTPDKRRSSRDIQRGVDGGACLEIRTRLRSLSHRRRKDNAPTTPPEAKSATIVIPAIRYLLVSPLTPPISTLLAPALGLKHWNRIRGVGQDVVEKHASLVVYGDQDSFTSVRRIRDWSDQVKTDPASQFTDVEVAGAGHFWMEGDAEEKLRAALKEWESRMR